MEEEHSTLSSSNSHRLHIRRNLLRQTTTLRSSPYNSTLSNIRRRQTSIIASQTINNLLTNIENNDRLSSEQEHIQTDNIIPITDDENENFEVLVDFSNTNHEQNQSYHSLSTLDFDPDDDDDDDEDERYYYTSTSIPVLDYSATESEPLVIENNPSDIPEDEYSSSINNNSNDDEDLSIEIILETSQNQPLSPIPRRRRSIISSNIRQNHGLALSDIINIPQKLYNSIEKSHQTECYICLEEFQSIDLIKILNCQHIFHVGCINQWLRFHSNCAYCRAPITRSSNTRQRERTRARRNNNHFIEQQEEL